MPVFSLFKHRMFPLKKNADILENIAVPPKTPEDPPAITALHDVVERLMQENARHRETFEEVRRTLRCDLGKDTEGLRLNEALKVAINERDKALRAYADIKENLRNVKKLALDGKLKEAVELCQKLLAGHP